MRSILERFNLFCREVLDRGVYQPREVCVEVLTGFSTDAVHQFLQLRPGFLRSWVHELQLARRVRVRREFRQLCLGKLAAS